MRRFIITLVTLVICSMPVRAEEKVWYCEMVGFISTGNSPKIHKNEKFKMEVMPSRIVFGTGGRFDRWSMTVRNFNSAKSWIAQGLTYTAGMDNSKFLFSQISTEGATAISAICDNF